MFKRQKEIDRKVDELFDQLYEIEGEITDILTHYIFEIYKNKNEKNLEESQSNHSDCGDQIINFLSESVCDEILQFECEDFYSDIFFIELTTSIGDKKYFQMTIYGRPVNCHDEVKIIAQPQSDKKFDKIYAIINTEENFFWTSMGIEKGRIKNSHLRITIFIKLVFWLMIFLIFGCLFLNFLLDDAEEIVLISYTTGKFMLGIVIFSLWIVMPNENDYQEDISSEALFKKMGFFCVKKLNIAKYSLLDLNKSRGVEVDSFFVHRQARTYLLESALSEHNQQYKK